MNHSIYSADRTTHLKIVVVALVVGGRPSHSRWIVAILALFWGWMAVAYHFAYFARINPAAWLFAGLFLVQAGHPANDVDVTHLLPCDGLLVQNHVHCVPDDAAQLVPEIHTVS